MHHGSALIPFLFAVVMDRLTDEVRQESPRTMFFADDTVVVVVVVVACCCCCCMQVEETLDRWRYTLGRGLKIIRVKTEYIEEKREKRSM